MQEAAGKLHPGAEGLLRGAHVRAPGEARCSTLHYCSTLLYCIALYGIVLYCNVLYDSRNQEASCLQTSTPYHSRMGSTAFNYDINLLYTCCVLAVYLLCTVYSINWHRPHILPPQASSSTPTGLAQGATSRPPPTPSRAGRPTRLPTCYLLTTYTRLFSYLIHHTIDCISSSEIYI